MSAAIRRDERFLPTASIAGDASTPAERKPRFSKYSMANPVPQARSRCVFARAGYLNSASSSTRRTARKNVSPRAWSYAYANAPYDSGANVER